MRREDAAASRDAHDWRREHFLEETSVQVTRLSGLRPSERVSPPRPIVFVVDDDISVRESLEPLIALEGWQPEVFASADEFLARPRVTVPNCVVLDVGLPDTDGLHVQRLLAHRREMPIIFVAGYTNAPMIVHAIKAGAVEFLTKPIACDALLSAIRHALAHSRAALDREAEIMPLRERHAALSRRECEVMRLIVSGRLNKQVAAELGITEFTVKAHRRKVMRKMQVRSLASLVTMSAKLGIAPARHSSATNHSPGEIHANAHQADPACNSSCDREFHFCLDCCK